MDEMGLKLLEGQIGLPAIGAVRQNASGLLPYGVVEESGREFEAFSEFLRDLVLTDMSPLTARSCTDKGELEVATGEARLALILRQTDLNTGHL